MGDKRVRSNSRNRCGPVPRPNETEEEAAIRRFHDAQRMARFRAKRKKALKEAHNQAELAVLSEIKRRDVIVELREPVVTVHNPRIIQPVVTQSLYRSQTIGLPSASGQSKYSQLLGVIEELGKDIRLTYAGSRTSAERVRTGIARAKFLVKDCLMEAEINS